VGAAPSPAALRAATSPRRRGEVGSGGKFDHTNSVQLAPASLLDQFVSSTQRISPPEPTGEKRKFLTRSVTPRI
jgi:ribosomal protein S18